MHESNCMFQAFCGLHTCDGVEPMFWWGDVITGLKNFGVEVHRPFLCLIHLSTTSPFSKISASLAINVTVHPMLQKLPIKRME